MSNRCGWHVGPSGERFFMPGCVGGAAMGLNYCTCASRRSLDRIEELELRIEKLEAAQ